MEPLDIFYRAYKQYLEMTKVDVSTNRIRKAFEDKNDPDKQNLTVFVATCTIDEDWIDRIEFGLEYIAKAIKEERQFIRNDGEVLPIEKVRKTSKASIEDLARHSNYITHEPMEGAASDIVPDKLLVVQREHDFTVYENRVVYALLVHLRDFINSRLTEIKEVTNTYEATSYIKQHIALGSETIDVDFRFKDVRKNDPYFMMKNSYRQAIEKLDDLLSKVLILLKTPLMVEVSKVDMISLPIVKTNVLKMNHNFRECVSLFEYILAFDKPGYTVSKEEKTFAPFAMDLVHDYTEVVLLYSFISYMRSNELEDVLKANFDQEEERRRLLEEEDLLERASKIKLKASDDEKTLLQYVMTLQEAYKVLEGLKENLEKKIAQKEKEHLKEVEALNQSHRDEIDALRVAHEEEISSINEEHQQEIYRLNEDRQNQIDELTSRHAEEVSNLNNEHRNEMSETRSRYEDKIKELNDLLEETKSRLESENRDLTSHLKETEGRLKAMQSMNGELDSNAYNDKVDFDELERQKEAFDKFYKEAWKKAKKAIRKNNIHIDKKKKKVEETPTENVDDGGEE